jgi:hypothetical protein
MVKATALTLPPDEIVNLSIWVRVCHGYFAQIYGQLMRGYLMTGNFTGYRLFHDFL